MATSKGATPAQKAANRRHAKALQAEADQKRMEGLVQREVRRMERTQLRQQIVAEAQKRVDKTKAAIKAQGAGKRSR